MSLQSVFEDYQSYKGTKVYLKTNFSPEFLVYDSDDMGSSSPGIVEAAVRVTDRQENELIRYGEHPETDYVLMLSGAVILFSAATLLVRGLVKK